MPPPTPWLNQIRERYGLRVIRPETDKKNRTLEPSPDLIRSTHPFSRTARTHSIGLLHPSRRCRAALCRRSTTAPDPLAMRLLHPARLPCFPLWPWRTRHHAGLPLLLRTAAARLAVRAPASASSRRAGVAQPGGRPQPPPTPPSRQHHHRCRRLLPPGTITIAAVSPSPPPPPATHPPNQIRSIPARGED
ncbi:hypothetical protein BS78_02G000500 [Paspalum vaginatum]|nr:hypothetical protein BS78_02G000500 [Paspalum vaginatum]